MNTTPSIVWFRHDLRTADNPALSAALKRGGPVVPLFIWSPEEERPWAPGEASRWWLHRSLASLWGGLRSLGSHLVIRRGESLPTLKALVAETGAGAVFWNRRYEPQAIGLERKVESSLLSGGLHAESFNARLLFEPSEVATRQGKPFQVFTAFWKACRSLADPPEPLPAPARLPYLSKEPESLPLDSLELEPSPERASGLASAWRPGEEAARGILEAFLEEGLPTYPSDRDRPHPPGGSRLSPYLHFGEISPRQVWHAVKERSASASPGSEDFPRQLGWREFASHLLFHFPHTSDHPLRKEFSAFPWLADKGAIEAWRRGQTGYPFVDAAMRELHQTGWMPNRPRMVVASFLVKDLLVPWQEGARWFWESLVDADLANNTLGWQWSAGCGADAAPFFRVFNPVKQGEKFDPGGDYVRRWVPEVSGLPPAWVHQPFDAPASVLKEAGIKLGQTYPEPIVSHAFARQRALAAWASIRKRSKTSGKRRSRRAP